MTEQTSGGQIISDEYGEELAESYRKAVSDLALATGVGAYVISDEASKNSGETGVAANARRSSR